MEFALVFPIMCFAALGFVEAGFLLGQKAHQDRATDDVAEWAAAHPNASWNSIATDLLKGCSVTVTTQRDVVDVRSTCTYDPRITRGLWEGLQLRSHETAIVRSVAPSPTASPVPS